MAKQKKVLKKSGGRRPSGKAKHSKVRKLKALSRSRKRKSKSSNKQKKKRR